MPSTSLLNSADLRAFHIRSLLKNKPKCFRQNGEHGVHIDNQ